MVLTTTSSPGAGNSSTAIPPGNGTLITPGLSSIRPLSARAMISAFARTRMTLRSLTASCARALDRNAKIKRIREPCPDLLGDNGWRWRVLRTSNAYAFTDPSPAADRPKSSKSEKADRNTESRFFLLQCGGRDGRQNHLQGRSQSPSGVRTALRWTKMTSYCAKAAKATFGLLCDPDHRRLLPEGYATMMKFLITSALALAFAGPSQAQVSKTNEPAPDTLITLQRDACESRCAVYRLVIFADGTVIYEGRYFVRHAGLIKSGISPEVLNKLIGDLEAGGFFQLDNNYGYGNNNGCESMDPDRPMAILSVSNQGRSKTVLHHHRCIGPVPNRITDLEDRVDVAVGVAKWIK